jgi:hypothetical protein
MTLRPPVELKAYYRDLVTACGGPKRSADIVGGHQSHISEAMAPHCPDRWPRLDHIALLEAECGQPIMTAALAERAGYAIEQVAAAPRGQKSVSQHLHAIVSEFQDVEIGMISAMADGRIDAAERRDLRRDIQQAVQALQKLGSYLAEPVSDDAGNVKPLTMSR